VYSRRRDAHSANVAMLVVARSYGSARVSV
jgi:hypothetical protein